MQLTDQTRNILLKPYQPPLAQVENLIIRKLLNFLFNLFCTDLQTANSFCVLNLQVVLVIYTSLKTWQSQVNEFPLLLMLVDLSLKLL